MRGLYLAALLFSIAGMIVIDLRWRLFFRADARRASVVLALGVAFLLLWDVAGVGLGIFFIGPSSLLLGVDLRPNVPIEELFFLVLLCYLTMNVYAATSRARAGDRSEGHFWPSPRRQRRRPSRASVTQVRPHKGGRPS